MTLESGWKLNCIGWANDRGEPASLLRLMRLVEDPLQADAASWHLRMNAEILQGFCCSLDLASSKRMLG